MELIEMLRNNKGSVILETAVMFILIIVLIVGFMHLTNAVSIYAVAQTAAREGAREYAVTNNRTRAINKAKTELELGRVDPAKARITAVAEGQERRMIVTIDYSIYLPFAGKHDITLQGGATFRRVGGGR